MSASSRELVQALLAARNAGSSAQVHAHLAPDATYWDCLSGRVRGAGAVAEALAAGHVSGTRPRFVAERLVAGDRHAAAELRVREAGESSAPGYLATEVYVLRAGLVAECRSYIDPEDAQRG